jgi:uncharacterized membrane protein
MPRRLLLSVVIVAALLWATALAAAPLVASVPGSAGPTTSALLYAAGSFICHQQPDRSFHVGAAQLPVCARCLGLYLGGACGALAWGAWRMRRSRAAPLGARLVRLRAGIIAASLPTLLTVTTAWLGWWDPGNDLRFASALPLGVAAGLIVAAVAAGDLE